MALTDRSDEDISKLLAEYGIKHGPIVGEKYAHEWKYEWFHEHNDVITTHKHHLIMLTHSLEQDCSHECEAFE